MKKEEKTPEIKAVNAVDESVDKIIQEIEEEIKVTCCNVEITQEIKDIGLCPQCLEHI